MKALYPASNEIPKLNDQLLALKIARHSPCTACDSCSGLHPQEDLEVSLDDSETDGDIPQYDSGADDGAGYLTMCACGHDVWYHGADMLEIGGEEFARRGRVAVRLDEILQTNGKLLEFGYLDDDIKSLRKQMRIPALVASSSVNVASSDRSSSLQPPLSPASSVLSDPSQPPAKKRRISSSSLSDADEDEEEDEEEDKPLAARVAITYSVDRPERTTTRLAPGQRSGKKKTTKGHTAPTSSTRPTAPEQAEMNSKVNGINGHENKVKVEERLDENQLTRLATGVTVDAGRPTPPTNPVKPEKAAAVELRKGIIQITPVENDGQPRSLVILTGLKTLFQKQLPKMPREYIARLVYDDNSKSLAIIKRGYKVVGGICYRPFPHRGFAEIVFFATSSVDQEKGYGGMLMDHFKMHIRRTYPDMMHFLTYADNYAVGYFWKQGFSKDITLDRSVWAGYIKDYEGGTIMQCTMLRKVDYLKKNEIITQQRQAILAKIREMSKSHLVYDGLSQFQEGADPNVTVDPKDVPGLRESGWTPTMATAAPVQSVPRTAEQQFMRKLLSELQAHPQAWPFLAPVNGEEVVDYYEVIKRPMDFSTMEHKLSTNQYSSLDEFVTDAQLIYDNCRLYNPEGTIYAKNATRLEKYMRDQLADRLKKGVGEQ